jgi:hypothetical protein
MLHVHRRLVTTAMWQPGYYIARPAVALGQGCFGRGMHSTTLHPVASTLCSHLALLQGRTCTCLEFVMANRVSCGYDRSVTLCSFKCAAPDRCG